MRLPTRKSESDKYAMRRNGPIQLTPAGLEALEQEMKDIQAAIPGVREELIETREMGDLSENAGYQIAKATLRRLQNRLLKLQEDKKRVVLIKTTDSGRVQLGSTVVVELRGKERTFHLVGPRESNPAKGLISHRSPLGSKLLGARKGEVVLLKRDTDSAEYKILKIK